MAQKQKMREEQKKLQERKQKLLEKDQWVRTSFSVLSLSTEILSYAN